MRKRLAGILCTLLCAALLCSFALAALASPTTDFYVNDYANVLSKDTEQHIMDCSVPLAEETGAQVVVLTINSLEKRTVEDYAVKLFRDWGIGDAEENNGVLILLATGDRKIRVEVGYGLEGAINDAKAGRFIRDYAQDYYANDEFDAGTLELYNAVLSAVRAEYGLDTLEGYEDAASDDEAYVFDDGETDIADWLLIAIFIIILLSVLSSVIIGIINLFRVMFHLRPIRGGCLLGSGGPSGGGFFGGFSGGGGGGGFSGGGGSSGGGGASGSF